ncbi:MAG: cation:proton antiporter subunit C [Pirellulaceae bacterium]
MSQILGLYNYWVVICLMMIGFYIVIARGNLIKKVIGLNIFQISVFLLHITMGKVEGGTPPIIPARKFKTGAVEEFEVFSNPLPSVLMLTAIVVGVATTSLALALIVRIREAYGTVEEDEILAADQESQC